MHSPRYHARLASLIGLGVLAFAPAGAFAQSVATPTSKPPANARTSAANGADTALTKIQVIARELSLTQIPMSSAYSESMIGSSAIRFASPMLDVQGLLERTPSVNVRTPAANGVRTNITFRAFSSGQFSETFDGVPINDPFNGGTTNSASTRNNIYRGINNPAVTAYNSLGGTIAFEPRDPSVAPAATVSAGGGSFHTVYYGLTAQTGEIAGVRSMISVNHNSSSGWQANSGNRNTNLYYGGVLPYAGGDGEVYAYAIYNANKGLTPHTAPLPLVEQYGYGFGWPLDWTYSYNQDHGGTYIVGDRMHVNSWLAFNARVYARNVAYDRVSYTNPAFAQSATQPYALPNTGGPGTNYHNYLYATHQYGVMPHFTLTLPDNLVKFGGDYSHTTLHSAEFWYGSYPMPLITGASANATDAWDEHDGRTLGSAFLQDEVTLLDGTVHVTPGVKYLFARTSDFDNLEIFYPISGTVSDRESYTSPTLGLNWRPIPNLSLYAAWGETAKFPGISAYYNNVGQTNAAGQTVVVPLNVKPEYVRDIELGARYADHGLAVALNVYRENFSNTFIQSTNPATQLSSTTNGGSSRYEGVEIDLRDAFETPIGAFSVFGNFSQNKAYFTSSFTVANSAGTAAIAGQSVSSGEPLAGVPKTLGNLGVGWKWRTWRADVSEHYAGSQYVYEYNAGLPGAQTIPSYAVMNFTLRDTLPLRWGAIRDLKLALHVDNVLNRHYYTFGYGDTTYAGTSFVRAIYEEPAAFFGTVAVDF
jgi:outer membrane receptor protein involved in Fe transport